MFLGRNFLVLGELENSCLVEKRREAGELPTTKIEGCVEI